MVGHRCHSCNTTETPEWRRGPDGARTLCNACGLREHNFALNLYGLTQIYRIDYSKLLKKGSLTIQTHNYINSPPPSSDQNSIQWS